MSRRLAQGFSSTHESADAAPVRAVVALGANLGDRETTLTEALRSLARLPLTTDVVAASPIETVALTPEGPDPDAPAYLNSVALLHTRLAPSVLLGYLHAIEAAHGREEREPGAARWQDRTLDLDLIAYGDVQSDDPALQLPHPRAAERDFVLRPWLTVDPDAELPGHGRVADLLSRLGERGDAS
ncbi:2-amino-4-hydroxy-6-hydroxymethyldihydropteridine diphosphokinase [Microbacterium sp. zg.Y909]|uniref:2-amino-4-hydroxy-6- hydroxymethyldihydropteridine diphosphokinase n=1 Tax=Microbacterium sp. zg.Y909 TaxID=2969413 RepID=UPI00214CB82D|nr:2-amino-4-hydroxy-6-hydroxymethyldihydropteridine diphosphokinase [Microbacterium sp. zg.Y909]MCR2825516.1 2-amino-4-hydroxy-6-hydroxymethyldihydropteridine diphosphokinase [Microbacterium sp. zg.Y909]